ncbi:MAG TPA: zf-HC2 domain-containing protein [Armatimonadota bacterium]|jgi:hypothetical protein
MNKLSAINCKQTERWLRRRVAGELPASAETRLAEHLHACSACAASARRLETALAALHAQTAPEPPRDLARRIKMAALPVRPVAASQRWYSAPALAAAGLALAVVALALSVHLPPTTPPASGVAVAPANSPVAAAPPAVRGVSRAAAPRLAALPTPSATPAPLRAVRGKIVPAPGAGFSVPAPAPLVNVARPRPAAAHAEPSVTAAVMTQADSATPVRLASAPLARPRVAAVKADDEPRAARRTSGNFADEAIGGMIAGAVLSSYLEGAPNGVHVQPVSASGGAFR